MKEIFASSSYGLSGLLFFFIFFCGVVIWTLRPSAKKEHQKNAEIPIKDADK